MMQLLIDDLVLAPLDEGGPVVSFGGGLQEPGGRQAGLLQVEVQPLHLIYTATRGRTSGGTQTHG